jgi:hypothetical protein
MDCQLNIINQSQQSYFPSPNKKFIIEKKLYFVCKHTPTSTHQTKQYDNCKKYDDFCSAIDYYNTHQHQLKFISTSNTPLSIKDNSIHQTYTFQEKETFFYN